MPRDPLVSTGWQMLFGGIVMLVSRRSPASAAACDLGAFSTKSVLALLYLVVVGSLVAYSAYTWLLQNAPISQVATYAYVNPIVAVVLGWAILDEQVPATMIAASAVIVARSPRSSAPRPEVSPTPRARR